MTRLAAGRGAGGGGGGPVGVRNGGRRAEPGGKVAAAESTPVCGHGLSRGVVGDLGLLDQPAEEGFGEAIMGDGVGLAQAGVEPVGEREEAVERRRGVRPDQGQGQGEPAAVGDEVPVSGEAAQALDGGEIQHSILENLVRRHGGVAHGPVGVVPYDGGAAQAFEHADLDFLGTHGDQAVETGAETFESFAGKPDDEIGVDMDAGGLAEELEIGGGPLEILAAADAGADLGIEGL